mmetsp:Transcript_7284/g.23990  ORF Transcript_7284/g.23990 Transcript_7284/m.23990 type:complete len:641 (-) Transcript_7284:2227-4149(-)
MNYNYSRQCTRIDKGLGGCRSYSRGPEARGCVARTEGGTPPAPPQTYARGEGYARRRPTRRGVFLGVGPGGPPQPASRASSAAKLVPRLDVHWLTAVDRLGDEGRELDVGEQADRRVDRRAPDEEAVRLGVVVGLGVAHVDDEVHLAALDRVLDVGLRLGERLLHQGDIEAARLVKVVRAFRAADAEAHRDEAARLGQEGHLRLERAEAEEDGPLRDAEARRDHRGEDRVVGVLAKGCDLARRRHLDSEHRVGADEPREGEHGCLDADVLVVEQRDAHRGRVVADHHLGRELDEVGLERLGREGEGARRAHVRLDHLDLVILCEQLQVERAADLELGRDLARDALDAPHRLDEELLRRQHERGVTRVDAGVLNVLGDGVVEDGALARDSVHLDLLGALDELGDDYGVVGRHLARDGEEALQVRVGEDNLHRGAGEDVRGPDEARVARRVAKGLRVGDGGHLTPVGLVDADLVEDGGELVPVLRLVDVGRLGAEDVCARRLERQREVVWRLAADRDDDAEGGLVLVDVHHALGRDLLKVELVALVVVGRDRLGVEVDHDGAVAELAQCADARDGAPVELHRRADPVRAAAEHHRRGRLLVEAEDAALAHGLVGHGAVVRHVEVVGLRGELGGERVDLLDDG